MEREKYRLVPFNRWDAADEFAGENVYLLAPTEEAAPWHLARMGVGRRVFEINRSACNCARRRGFPLAAVLGPIDENDFGTLYANYHEQVKSLLFSEPELIALVGIRSLENLRAACVAVREFFTETVLFLTHEPDEREAALCSGFKVIPVKAADGAPWRFEKIDAGREAVFFHEDVVLKLGPGLPVGYVRWRGGRAFLGQPAMGEIEILEGKPGEIETACRRSCCRPVIAGGIPGRRESRARMYAAAKFGGAVMVPLTEAEDAVVNLPLLAGRARTALSEAAEAGIPAESVFLDLTGQALEIPESGFWLRVIEDLVRSTSAPVGLGRLPRGESLEDAFPDLAVEKGAAFLPASERTPVRPVRSVPGKRRAPEPVGVS